MNRLIQAIHFSAEAHRNQRRKDSAKTPYINHPIEVMYLLSAAGVEDIDTLCAAVLHDTIEDTSVHYAYLVYAFGENVARIVMECSDDKTLPKVERKKKQIRHTHEISTAAKLVKAADKLSNVSSLASNPPSNWSKEEIDGYFCWSYVVCQGLFGYNTILDIKLRKIFKEEGLMDINVDELQERLEVYYVVIQNKD